MSMHCYSDNPALVAELAPKIAETLRVALAVRGYANLAVSGGNTPKTLFTALSKQVIDWQHVQITLVDERWVTEADVNSNARLVREYLLQNLAADARFVSLKVSQADVFASVDAVAAKLQSTAVPLFPLDIVVLGMGEDGHTASWHPGSETLAEVMDVDNDKICGAVRPMLAPYDRMTLTMRALMQARLIVLHLVGERKKSVLDLALQPGSVAALPLRGIMQQTQVPTEIYYAKYPS
ncbi:MAG: 6-phosphogluconolactonase [Candidatus Azotimanducaceae bacterium]|jgi:6-phosphogluconolactonase